MSERRKFIMINCKFDNDKKPRRLLIPVDQIHRVVEDLSKTGGCEIFWTESDCERPTITHTLDHIKTIYLRLEGAEHWGYRDE